MMKRIALIGGAGFIGAALIDQIQESSDLLIYDNFVNFLPNGDVHNNKDTIMQLRFSSYKNRSDFVYGDILNKQLVKITLQNFKPEVVIHLAAIPIANYAKKYPQVAIDVNVLGLLNVLDACSEVGSVKRFVFLSSSYVYGDFKQPLPDEDTSLFPKDVYGTTKLSGEKIVKQFSLNAGFEYTIIRPSAVYGPNDLNSRVCGIFLENAINNKPVIIHDENTKLDFTYVTDLVDGILLAINHENAANNTFNMTYGQGRSIIELAEILRTWYPGMEIIVDSKSNNDAPKRGGLNISKAQDLLGYNPKFPLEKGLESYVQHYTHNNGKEMASE